MFAQVEIPQNDRLSEPIAVTVADVTNTANDRVDCVVTVRDEIGAELPLTIWTTHEIGIDWEPGTQYLLDGVRGNRWNRGGTTECKLSSTADLTAIPTKADSHRFLLVGDTHVGYRHRLDADKPSWARGVDNRSTFRSVFQKATELDVDGIIHAGDIFDHTTDRTDHETVTEATSAWTSETGRSFSFVFGNHDVETDRDRLRKLEATTRGVNHLPSGGNIGLPNIDVIGIDYQGDVPAHIADRGSAARHTIVVIHETPYPVVDGSGTYRYKEGRLNLRKCLDRLNAEVDLVVAGHMHVAERGWVEGTDVPVVVTGPTASISAYERDNEPSVWLLDVTTDEITIERHRLEN